MPRHGYCEKCGVLKPVRPVEIGAGPKMWCFTCRKAEKRPAVDPPVETVEFLEAVQERSKAQQQLREALALQNIGRR